MFNSTKTYIFILLFLFNLSLKLSVKAATLLHHYSGQNEDKIVNDLIGDVIGNVTTDVSQGDGSFVLMDTGQVRE